MDPAHAREVRGKRVQVAAAQSLPGMAVMLRAQRLGWLFPLLGGCFFDCEGGVPEPEADCVDAEAPSESHAVIIGSAEDDQAFERLSDGAELKLDYGSQGGQHFYYSVRLFGATADQTLVVTFTPTGAEPAGGSNQGGGAEGGAPAGGGTGAGGACCESALPSGFVALAEYVEDADCDGEWLEVENLILQVYDGAPSGVLRVELGSCDGACPVSEAGVYVHSRVDAAAEVELTYEP